FEVLLDQKRQVGDAVAIGFGQKIQRMQIASRSEYRKHLAVEMPIARQVARSYFRKTELHQLQLLDWINGVHSALQRQVHIRHFQHQQGLLDNPQTILLSELQFLPCETQEL